MTTWILHDKSRGRKREFDNRAEAQNKKQDLMSLGADSLSLYPKNESEDEGDEIASDGVEPELVDQTEEAKADGGSAESVPSADSQSIPDSVDSDEPRPQPTQEEMEADPDIITGPEDLEQESEGYDLPDKPRVDQDPLTWMPEEFTDTIDGSVAINRKGFEVLCQHFGVSVKPECQINPYETDFEYAQCRAVATDAEGTEYVAYGSAHVDRGDDPGQLLEMADTRSYKRAASRATGVGMLAVEEIQNGVSGQ